MLLNSKRIYSTRRLKTRPTFKTLPPYYGTGGAALLAALPWQAAILDQEGGIIAVNEAWRRFAAEDGATTFPESGLGLNYFDVSRPAFGPREDAAQQAYQGIREVLARQRALFTLEYPYPSRVSPTSERWFQLTATPLANGQPGALIQRLDITAHKLDTGGREKTLGSAYAITPRVSHHERGIDPYQQPHRPLESLLAMAHALTTPTAQVGSADAYTVAHTLAEQAMALFGCETVSFLALNAETQTLEPLAVVARRPFIELAWQQPHGRMARFGDRFDPSLISRLYRDEVIVMEADASNESAQASWLLAPMRSMGRLRGIVRLDYGVRAHHFTTEELSLARAVARMAALVVEQRNVQDERDQAIRERAEATTRELTTREAAQHMELFIALAGHEFRTPLTVLQGQLYLAERKLSASMPQGEQTSALTLTSLRESLDAAQRAAGRLGSLVDDLLAVTHARTGKLVVHPEWCDLVTLVRDQVADHRQLYPSRRLRLHVEGPRHIYIQADPVRLAQVLTNYLNNACKYSPDSRPIRVDVRVGEGTARISVRDQGPGLSPDVQARIWERFYQAPDIQPQSGSDAGLGLGLYISRLIVEQHGGEVGVESEVGKGATFWCTVPLRMEAS